MLAIANAICNASYDNTVSRAHQHTHTHYIKPRIQQPYIVIEKHTHTQTHTLTHTKTHVFISAFNETLNHFSI